MLPAISTNYNVIPMKPRRQVSMTSAAALTKNVEPPRVENLATSVFKKVRNALLPKTKEVTFHLNKDEKKVVEINRKTNLPVKETLYKKGQEPVVTEFHPETGKPLKDGLNVVVDEVSVKNPETGMTERTFTRSDGSKCKAYYNPDGSYERRTGYFPAEIFEKH